MHPSAVNNDTSTGDGQPDKDSYSNKKGYDNGNSNSGGLGEFNDGEHLDNASYAAMETIRMVEAVCPMTMNSKSGHTSSHYTSSAPSGPIFQPYIFSLF
jgi:hypothetical protein